MSFCCYGKIEIWGNIKDEDRQELIDAIEEDQPETESDSYEEHIQEYLGDTLTFQSSEARGGEFSSIEDACRELGLNFLRYSGSDYDSAPCYSWYVDKKEGYCVLTIDEEIYMPAESIVRFCVVAREFKGENAPALLNSADKFESLLAKHFLDTGEVLTIEEYAQGLLTEVPETGTFNIIP